MEEKANRQKFPTKMILRLISSYIYFLLSRPISKSNIHYAKRQISLLQNLSKLLPLSENDIYKKIYKNLCQIEVPDNFRQPLEELLRFMEENNLVLSTIPKDYFVVENGPRGNLNNRLQKILIVMGPGIGIGDEITFFNLPRKLRTIDPVKEITVATGYNGLWNKVGEVNSIIYYGTDLKNILELILGYSGQSFDFVIWVDFFDAKIAYSFFDFDYENLFLEISLAEYSARLLKKDSRKIYYHKNHFHRQENTYLGMEYLYQVCFDTEYIFPNSEKISPSKNTNLTTYKILVNPFTTKYDPNMNFWSDLLIGIANLTDLKINYFLNSGLNKTTEENAKFVCKRVCDASNGNFEANVLLKDPELNRDIYYRLGDLLELSHQCDVIIGTDSLTAHMAPLGNCLSLVVGLLEHKAWHVPNNKSFFFDQQLQVDDLIMGMSTILKGSHLQRIHHDYIADEEWLTISKLVDNKSNQFSIRMDTPINYAELVEFFEIRDLLIKRTRNDPIHRYLLTDDLYYIERQPQKLENPTEKLDYQAYLEGLWFNWENSNLRKFIRIIHANKVGGDKK